MKFQLQTFPLAADVTTKSGSFSHSLANSTKTDCIHSFHMTHTHTQSHTHCSMCFSSNNPALFFWAEDAHGARHCSQSEWQLGHYLCNNLRSKIDDYFVYIFKDCCVPWMLSSPNSLSLSPHPTTSALCMHRCNIKCKGLVKWKLFSLSAGYIRILLSTIQFSHLFSECFCVFVYISTIWE